MRSPHRPFAALLFLTGLAACLTPVLASRPDSMRGTSACEAGLWVPESQEPEAYLACQRDEDCVKIAIFGCCSEYQVALSREHLCWSDQGNECDQMCDEVTIRPKGAEYRRAACIDSRCALR